MDRSVPIAIVVAGAMIALSVYLVFGGKAHTATAPGTDVNIPVVTADDHILGDPNAPVKIVEYGDLDCTYCRQFNVTMKQIMATYGASGEVAWVFREFPIKELHPNAPKLAEAAECVADLGGNTAFWKFTDSVFTSTPVSGFFDMNSLDATAISSGVSLNDFKTCLTTNKFQKKVQASFDDAIAAGAEGTPQNFIVTATETIPVPGSQPYATIKSILDTVLAAAH